MPKEVEVEVPVRDAPVLARYATPRTAATRMAEETPTASLLMPFHGLG
jgi:hypothetical protein